MNNSPQTFPSLTHQDSPSCIPGPSWTILIVHRVGDRTVTSRAALSRFSHVWLFVTPWIGACQAPLSLGFSRQGYQSGWPCPPAGDLPDPGIETGFPALAGGFFTTSATWSELIFQNWQQALFKCLEEFLHISLGLLEPRGQALDSSCCYYDFKSGFQPRYILLWDLQHTASF